MTPVPSTSRIASGAPSSMALAAPRPSAFGTSGGSTRATATEASAVATLSSVASQALGCQTDQTAARWVVPSAMMNTAKATNTRA